MAAGTKILTINQYGLEGATHGASPVAADTRLLCQVELPATDRTVVIPQSGIGKRVSKLGTAAYVQRIGAEGVRLTTPDGLYYQILPLLFSSCIIGNITPAEQSSGQDDYLWAFTDPLTGVETLETFTLESGDGTGADEAFEIAYCIVREIEIAGNADSGEVMLTATIDGDQLTETTLTSVATMPTYTAVLGGLARLYIDDSWASLGQTEVTAGLLDFSLRINGGGHLKRRGSSALTPGSHGQGEIEITLSMGLERAVAAVITEQVKYYTTTTDERFVRLIIDSGVAIGTGENHSLTIDIAGIWTGWHPMGRDQDGNNLNVVELTCAYDSTGTHAFDIDLITNVSAI